jgi:hypothetical protein
MSYIKSDDEFRVLVEPVFERVRRDLAGEHDSQTCDAANGKPCEMCVAADEYEAREARKVSKAELGAKNAPTASKSAGIDPLADGQGPLWADAATIRTAIADVLDAGYHDKGGYERAWLFLLNESDEETNNRSRFLDAVIYRIETLRK